MPRVSVNGVEVYYEEHGEGLPVLGIHGTPSSAMLWEEPAAELAKIEELATVSQPTLLISAEDSPDALRRVNSRLSELLPAAGSVLVPGGHLINPAHPAVLEFLGGLPAPSTPRGIR